MYSSLQASWKELWEDHSTSCALDHSTSVHWPGLENTEGKELWLAEWWARRVGWWENAWARVCADKGHLCVSCRPNIGRESQSWVFLKELAILKKQCPRVQKGSQLWGDSLQNSENQAWQREEHNQLGKFLMLTILWEAFGHDPAFKQLSTHKSKSRELASYL